MMLREEDPQRLEAHRTQERALRLLAHRAHSACELREKLLKHHDEECVDTIILELLEDGLLNDMDYARNRAESLSQQGRSDREIADRLRMAGVERQIVEEALSCSEIADDEKALKVLRKGYLEKLRRGEREKVITALARRGFSQRDILRALDEIEPEYNEEAE